MRYTLVELDQICQKPQWRMRGSMLARRFARPAALYITWLVGRFPVSANFITGCALAVGLAAAVLLAIPACFTCGVAALWLWYLLDHVDGQVARLHGTQSVTGVYFDYMMHHWVHPCVAFCVGYGVAVSANSAAWTLAGAAFALGVTALSLGNDCLYKAYSACGVVGSVGGQGGEQKAGTGSHVPGEEVVSGEVDLKRPSASHARPSLPAAIHRGLLGFCEIPNIIVSLSALAIAPLCGLVTLQRSLQVYVLAMAVIAPSLALLRLAKQVWTRMPDRARNQ